MTVKLNDTIVINLERISDKNGIILRADGTLDNINSTNFKSIKDKVRATGIVSAIETTSIGQNLLTIKIADTEVLVLEKLASPLTLEDFDNLDEGFMVTKGMLILVKDINLLDGSLNIGAARNYLDTPVTVDSVTYKKASKTSDARLINTINIVCNKGGGYGSLHVDVKGKIKKLIKDEKLELLF